MVAKVTRHSVVLVLGFWIESLEKYTSIEPSSPLQWEGGLSFCPQRFNWLIWHRGQSRRGREEPYLTPETHKPHCYYHDMGSLHPGCSNQFGRVLGLLLQCRHPTSCSCHWGMALLESHHSNIPSKSMPRAGPSLPTQSHYFLPSITPTDLSMVGIICFSLQPVLFPPSRCKGRSLLTSTPSVFWVIMNKT